MSSAHSRMMGEIASYLGHFKKTTRLDRSEENSILNVTADDNSDTTMSQQEPKK